MDTQSSVGLDLFKLHDSKDTAKNWILARGICLEEGLKDLIKRTGFPSTELVKHLMNKLNISITSAERLVYLKREWYPLIFIEELITLTGSSKYEIQYKIDFLKSSKPPVVEYKAVKELTINICKIAGAHAADGTLHNTYIAITDYHKSNISALINWFEEEFNYVPKLSRIGENEYGIRFHSRIISRYLTKFFNFPSGCKQYTVGEPDIIKNALLGFRKAFALGALTFEAGVCINNQIAFCVVSKAFRDAIIEILNELNIPYHSMERPSSGYWRFWSNILIKEEALKWIELFEPNTEKWFKVNDCIHDFSKKVNSIGEAMQIWSSIYPKQSASKITINDVLLALNALKQTHRYELADYLVKKNGLLSYGGKWAHSLRYYLDILKKANMILVKKGRFGKKKSFGTIIRDVYIFNENTPDWKLPERDNI